MQTEQTLRPNSNVRVLPITSERTPAGILKKILVTVEMATAKPMASGPTPKDAANNGRTGVRARL